MSDRLNILATGRMKEFYVSSASVTGSSATATSVSTTNLTVGMKVTGHSNIQENTFINKISSCFLQKVGVQYGGDRYTAYENIPGRGTPPQRSTLTLDFTELETLSQEHIEDGF